jgi:hypothetical protein
VRSIGRFLLVVASFGMVASCGDDEKTPAPGVCEEQAIACEDDIIQDLSLQDTPAPGLIDNTEAGGVFTTEVDATAGGAFAIPPDAYVYGFFTDDGLVKVDLDDESALASADWDIAFRRFIVRINSGSSGPSCVSAAVAVGQAFDNVTAAPSSAVFREDDYYTDDCTEQTDATGLGSPTTALSGFWDYSACLEMTGNVYILELADGRQLKLEIVLYYSETIQQECQDNGSVSSTSSAANYVLRWAFLD